jgi:PAS domain S-box-containing protein
MKTTKKTSQRLPKASQQGVLTVDGQGTVIAANKAATRLLGGERAILLGTNFFSLFTTPELVRAASEQALANGMSRQLLGTLRHPVGLLTEVLLDGTAQQATQPVGLDAFAVWQVVASDCPTQLLLATKEPALYEEEKKRQTVQELRRATHAWSLIEASQDPLITLSPAGRIMDLNQATATITGLHRAQLLGSDFYTYFTDPHLANTLHQAIITQGTVTDSALVLRHQDGQLRDVLCQGSVYKNEEGHLLGVVVVARDVTDQKRTTAELTAAKIAAERAALRAEKAQAEAERATVLAQQAVKVKQQFLSTMSHEIRTPMNAIVGFTQVVLKTNLTDKQREYLTAIKFSGDTLTVLIDDILDLAKVEAGKMRFEQVPFALSASVSALVHLFEPKTRENNLILKLDYDANIPDLLVGDPARLHQVILNLVSNAVKFTSAGTITVSARLLVQDAQKVILEFAVTDTGIGIEQAHLGAIFDDFQQAASSTSRLYGGTGLGLAIVKNLVESQGGTIHVKSQVGVGSTFSFVLSFDKTTEKAADNSSLPNEPETGFKDVKILVVEDVALNQLLMQTLLEDFGFSMDVADNGKIALEKLRTTHYDLVLMDLQMPVMNGFEATHYLRHELGLAVPIIALTADVTTVDTASCLAVGMNDYLSKPVDDRLLYSKIRKHLQPATLPKTTALRSTDQLIAPPTCVNFDYLQRITKSEARLVEMIELYLQEIPPLIQTMKSAIAQQEWTTLRVAAHALIPTFATMGMAPSLTVCAQTIEHTAVSLLAAGDDSRPGSAPELLAPFLELEAACTLASQELRKKLHLLPQPPARGRAIEVKQRASA